MATLNVYKTRSGKRYGVLSGGSTKDYHDIDGRWFESVDPENPNKNKSGDDRKWMNEEATACGLPPHEYAWSFERIYVKSDVERVGDNCFAYFENADVMFESPNSIKHLGKNAFARTAISGRVSLPGLEDSTFAAAFAGCTKLTEVDLSGSGVQTIGDGAFANCLNLKRVSGCGKVHTIGDKAFLRCAKLRDHDLRSDVLKNVGRVAFHISGMGARLDGFRNSVFASASRRKDKFDAQTLDAIRAVELPDVGGLPEHVEEQSYPDLKYAVLPDGTQDYMSNGCMMFSLYHVYQRMFPGLVFDNFGAWWEHVDGLCVDALGVHIWGTERYVENKDVWKILYVVLALLGLKPKDFSDYDLCAPNIDESCGYSCALMTYDETGKREIRDALARGYGVLASISTGKQDSDGLFTNTHMVAIVGCKNGKLLVVDSANIDGERGGVYEVAYEDLFMGQSCAGNKVVVVLPDGANT